MQHSTTETPLTPADHKLTEMMQQADDFFKIEILRPAKTYYERALALDPKNTKAKHRITECNKMLAFEMKVIWSLLALAAVLAGAYLLLRS
ncbi:MAG: hypothetical protein M0Q53_04635 [Prolixibacteraceae bacterium]|jgi:hypothetical protein|nr:hypothetical protein [Prolixibacteraceae bacterium]